MFDPVSLIPMLANLLVILVFWLRPPRWVQVYTKKAESILGRLMGANSALVRRGSEVIAEDLGAALPEIVFKLLPHLLRAAQQKEEEELKFEL